MEAHGIQGIVYADDTQLYKVFDQSNRDAALEACVADKKMTLNVLNDSEAEVVQFTSNFTSLSLCGTYKQEFHLSNQQWRFKTLVQNLTPTWLCQIMLYLTRYVEGPYLLLL